MNNKVSAEVTEAMMAEFKKDMEAIKAKYPWLISLTDEERNSGLRIGDKTYTFVSKVVEYVDSHPEYLPSYINVAELKKDFKLWNDLYTMLRLNTLLSNAITDTAIQAGNEAMEAALSYYSSVKEAAKRGAPGAQTIYDELRARFAGRPVKKEAAK